MKKPLILIIGCLYLFACGGGSDNKDDGSHIDTSDITAPTLIELTPIPTPNTDTTPSYTFSSDEAGTITYGGDCSSRTINAHSGSNTITFNTLSLGTHNNCTISVTDHAGNTSILLTVSTFVLNSPSSANSTPTADNLSIASDLATPFIQAQLSGADADNDTLIYVLDAPYEGVGYELAFVEASTGRFFAILRNDGVKEIVLPYKVSDGTLFSEAAEVTITIADIADGGLGADDIPADDYGNIELTFFDGDRFGAAPGSGPSIPSSIDLSGNFPPPGNQGSQGSCVGWATAYALKSYQEKVEEQWSFSKATTFSPAWIYNQINGGQDQGSLISEALQLIVSKGAATWQTMPYDDGNYRLQPGIAAFNEAAAYKGASWNRINGVQQMKAALANRTPIVVGISVFESFYAISGSSAVYNSATGNNLGGHAVTIVGYDDSRYGGAFKVINSWGINWGDNGYFWLPYSMISTVMNESYVLLDGPNTGTLPDDIPVAPIQDNLPNLQVAGWSITYDAQPGGEGEWQWEVINAGTSVALKGADVNLILSKDTTIDSSDWYVVYEDISVDLQPGGSVYRDETNSRSFKFPETIAAGIYYMAVWVDDLQEVKESDELDNQSFANNTITMSLPVLPDLSINYWWASWDDITGDGVLEYTVANNGTATTPRDDWYINLMLSDNIDPSLGESYFLFYEAANFILNPRGTIKRGSNNPAYFNVLWDVLLESYVPSGVYYMSLWLDDTQLINESNEINNVSTGSSLLTIYDDFLAKDNRQLKASSRNSKGNKVTSNFNGKHLPNNDLLMRKVEITVQSDGSRHINFLGDEVHKTAQKTSIQTNDETFSKVMTSADYAVFPRSSRQLMPKATETTYAK